MELHPTVAAEDTRPHVNVAPSPPHVPRSLGAAATPGAGTPGPARGDATPPGGTTLASGRKPHPPAAPVVWFALRKDVPRAGRRTAALAGFALCALVYVWASHQEWASATFFPRVTVLAATARELLLTPELWIDVIASGLRVTAGFLLAAALAIPLGVLMGSYRLFESFLQPPSEFMRYVPVPALVPLVMIFFGIDEGAKVALIFAGTFFQLLVMVADEIRRVPYELVQITQTLGATRTEIIRRVLFPAALPGICDALRLCNGWAWTYVVVAELVAATEGLGYRVLRFYRFIQTPQIYVYLLVLGLIGLTLDLALRRLNAHLFAWAETGRR
jgi:NitT/TauT family transport system permease protein